MKIGEKLLDMPKDNDFEAMKKVYEYFGFRDIRSIYVFTSDDNFWYNACRLVEMNNEVYQKLHPSCEDASQIDGKCVGYAKSETDDEPAGMCKECVKFVLYEEE